MLFPISMLSIDAGTTLLKQTLLLPSSVLSASTFSPVNEIPWAANLIWQFMNFWTVCPVLGGYVHSTFSHKYCYYLNFPWPTQRSWQTIAGISVTPVPVYSRSWRPRSFSHMLMNMLVQMYLHLLPLPESPICSITFYWALSLKPEILKCSLSSAVWNNGETVFQIFEIPFSRRIPGQHDLHASSFPNLITLLGYVLYTALLWIHHSTSTYWSSLVQKAEK